MIGQYSKSMDSDRLNICVTNIKKRADLRSLFPLSYQCYNLGAQAIRPCRSTLPALINCLRGSLYLRSTSILTAATRLSTRSVCSASKILQQEVHGLKHIHLAADFLRCFAIHFLQVSGPAKSWTVMEAESFSVWHDGSALSLYPSSGSPFRCFDRFDECFYHLPSPRLSASLHITSSQDIPSFHLDIPPIAAQHLHGMCRQLLFGGSRSQLITGLFDGPSQICQQTLQGAAWGMG